MKKLTNKVETYLNDSDKKDFEKKLKDNYESKAFRLRKLILEWIKQ